MGLGAGLCPQNQEDECGLGIVQVLLNAVQLCPSLLKAQLPSNWITQQITLIIIYS